MKKIGLIVGSLRKESYNRKLAELIQEILNEKMNAEILEIGNLPLYNEDIDNENPPKPYTDFRKKLDEMDGFIFVTPEYNRSYPAVIKNALDVGSRGEKNRWAKKPGAIVSSSPGAYGGFGSNNHLKQVLAFLDVPTLRQPEMYLGGIDESLQADGKFDQRTTDFIKKFVDAYLNHAKLYFK